MDDDDDGPALAAVVVRDHPWRRMLLPGAFSIVRLKTEADVDHDPQWMGVVLLLLLLLLLLLVVVEKLFRPETFDK